MAISLKQKLLRFKRLVPLLVLGKRFLLIWLWIFVQIVRAFRAKCFFAAGSLIVLAPYIAIRAKEDKDLASRGKIPEFHYTLS